MINILFCFTLIVQTTVVCEKKDGHMATATPYSACTCFQEILTEVEENGEGIQEIIDVLESGDGSVIGGGGSEEDSGEISGEDSGDIMTPNYPNFYPASSNEVISAYKY